MTHCEGPCELGVRASVAAVAAACSLLPPDTRQLPARYPKNQQLHGQLLDGCHVCFCDQKAAPRCSRGRFRHLRGWVHLQVRKSLDLQPVITTSQREYSAVCQRHCETDVLQPHRSLTGSAQTHLPVATLLLLAGVQRPKLWQVTRLVAGLWRSCFCR